MNTYNFRGKAPVYQTIVYSLLILILCAEIFPVIYIIMMSFASKQEIVTRGFFLVPREWTLDSYAYLIDNQNFIQAFRSSVTITTVGTVFSMLVTTLMAYGLSKSWLKGRGLLNFMVLFTLLFSGALFPCIC